MSEEISIGVFDDSSDSDVLCCEVTSFDELAREHSADELFKKPNGCFPELPAPFKNMVVNFKNLNGFQTDASGETIRDFDCDTRPHPAVEVGFKFSF